MSIKLFSHNQSAFASALDMLDSVGKAAVVHPTGTGKSYLTEDRIAALDQIGMEWHNPNEVRRYEAYSLAQEYYSEHGDLEMSHQYKAPNGYSLGARLHKQQKQVGEESSMCGAPLHWICCISGGKRSHQSEIIIVE